MNALSRSILVAFMIAAIAKPGFAETMNLDDGRGGSISAAHQRWAAIAATGVTIRINTTCRSACTVLLGYFPRNRICVTPDGAFAFHAAKPESATKDMLRAYPADIKTWLKWHGPLVQERYFVLEAPYIYRYFRRCSS